jgi:uncharacterized membrane protein
VLIALRVAAILSLLIILTGPTTFVPPASSDRPVVPILVDVSRSMRIADADGMTRLARAKAIAQFDLAPALSKKYETDVVDAGSISTSDLNGAVAAVRDRFRGRRIAGVVLISDGDDTGQRRAADAHAVPVFAVGVGSTTGGRDREVTSIAAGEQRLTDASVDIDVAATSAGFGRAPYDVTLFANGTLSATKRVTPSADASPDRVRFTVIPDAFKPTVYRAEIPAAPGEDIVENNSRSVLVEPAGRKRRVLVVAGAPGFEHSFMMRAWAADSGLDVDSVVRKGRNADARDTFVIQAPADRAGTLASGFPQRREDLFAYDAVVLANAERDMLTRPQLALVADFVAERGGGLLVAGSGSLSRGGLIGTALEPVLPVELDDRRAGVARASFSPNERAIPNQLVVTPDGESHPIMRLGGSGDETRSKWAALPALASIAPLGQPRAGASVLAVASSADGGVFPLVAVQKYGQGRSMIFGGEASWRWRMLAASTNRSHELFWRQAVRWLATPAPDRVSISLSHIPAPGDSATVDVVVRDASFSAVTDAQVATTVAKDDGAPRPLGRVFTPSEAGLYRIDAEATRGSSSVGSSDRTILVGGSDPEFADPRLNEGFLRRLARESGGRYVRGADASRVASWIDELAVSPLEPEPRDLWNRAWVFALVAALLCVEWSLRRRWGWR